MDQHFVALDNLALENHGDARERQVWPTVSAHLSQYERFWRTLIVLLTNRINPQIPVGPEWVRLRPNIPREYEILAMNNYSLFYYAATAREATDNDRRRVAGGKHPRPERVFFALQSCVDNAKELQKTARDILRDLGTRPELPKHPETLYRAIGAYRNAFTHNPLLGRAITHGRELLPPQAYLPKKRQPLLWSEVAQIPAKCMIDGLQYHSSFGKTSPNSCRTSGHPYQTPFRRRNKPPSSFRTCNSRRISRFGLQTSLLPWRALPQPQERSLPAVTRTSARTT